MASQSGIELNQTAIEEFKRERTHSNGGFLLEEMTKAFSSSLNNSARSSNNLLLKSGPAVGSTMDRTRNPKRGRDGAITQRKQHNKRGGVSRKIVTSAPDHDGYLWRKYGEKKINHNQFTRCYYRCTYQRDRNCKATKQVELHKISEPPLYRVTYFEDHTCTNIIVHNSNIQSSNFAQILDFSANVPPPTACLGLSSGGAKEDTEERSDLVILHNRELHQSDRADLLIETTRSVEELESLDFDSIWFDSPNLEPDLFAL